MNKKRIYLKLEQDTLNKEIKEINKLPTNKHKTSCNKSKPLSTNFGTH